MALKTTTIENVDTVSASETLPELLAALSTETLQRGAVASGGRCML